MSPEQLRGDPVAPEADLYSLAVVFFEMIIGQVPHDGGTIEDMRSRKLWRPPPPLHLIRPECPPALSAVVSRALEPTPAARWPSVVAFAEAVAAAVSRGQTSLPEQPRNGVLAKTGSPHYESLRFAGREDAVRRVKEAWAAARSGRSIVLWIEGDEGAGKSSFFELARAEAAADDAPTLIGRGFEAGALLTFGAWLPILRGALELQAGREGNWPNITALTDTDPATIVDTAGLYHEVTSLIHDESRRGPVFLGLEDLDYCDPASLSLLEVIAHGSSGEAFLLATTARALEVSAPSRVLELRERLRRLDRVVWVSLRPLTYDALDVWLEGALEKAAPSELVRHLFEHSDGNPFFIEQLLRFLLEQRQWDPSSPSELSYLDLREHHVLPLVEVVRRRLEVLSAPALHVLRTAAVVGREFDVDLLVTVSGRSEDAVLDAIDEAVAAGVLAPCEDTLRDRYRFSHVKIAHVLAKGINARRRRQLHKSVAQALDATGEASPPDLAWHWYRAGEPDRSAAAACRAAAQAYALHDYEDTLSFTAIAAESPRSDEERRRVYELRGDALRRLDRHAEAARAYTEAVASGAGTAAETTLVRCKQLRSALCDDETGAEAALSEMQLLAAASSGLADSSRAMIELALAEAQLAAGRAGEANETARAALDHAREAALEEPGADALLVLAAVALAESRLSEAQENAEEAAAVFVGLGDPYGAARAARLLLAVSSAGGDRSIASGALGRALALAERVGAARLARQLRQQIESPGS
jgi:hypothetical protein